MNNSDYSISIIVSSEKISHIDFFNFLFLFFFNWSSCFSWSCWSWSSRGILCSFEESFSLVEFVSCLGWKSNEIFESIENWMWGRCLCWISDSQWEWCL